MGRGGICQLPRHCWNSRQEHVQRERRILYVSIHEQSPESLLTSRNSHPQQARCPRPNQHHLFLALSNPLPPPDTTTRVPTNLITPPHRRSTRIQHLRAHTICPPSMASLPRTPTRTRTYDPSRLSTSNQARPFRVLRPRTRRSILESRQIRRCPIRDARRGTRQ